MDSTAIEISVFEKLKIVSKQVYVFILLANGIEIVHKLIYMH